MRIFSYRKLRRLFSFASMGISRSSGHGVRRRNAFKQRRDALNRHQLGNEPLEPRLLLAADITGNNKRPFIVPGSDSGFSSSDHYTNDTTPTFQLDAMTFGNNPAVSGPERLQLLIDGNVVASTPFNLNGPEPAQQLTVPNPLADGVYTATWRLTDGQTPNAGTSNSTGRTFTIDTTINPVSSRLVSGGNQSTGVHTPTDDIIITLTFDEEVEFGGGNTQSGGDPDTFINLNVGTPLSATDPVNPEVTTGRASGGLVTDQEYRFTVTANPGTSTDADGVFIDSVIGTFYDRAGNFVTDPTLGSYRGFKTGTLTFTNPVTSSTLFGVLDNSQISYPVSGITLLLDAPVPGPPVTPVGVAVGIDDFQLTRDGQVININAASITSPIIGASAFSEFLLGDLEQFTDEPGRYRLVFADASIGPIATLEWVKSVPTAGELVATLTPFPTDTTPTTPRNIPVEGIALEFLDNAGNPTPVTGVDTTAVGTAITQFEIYKNGVLQPFLTTPALGAVNISGSGSNYSINGLASFTNSDGYYQVFLSDSSAIETLDGTQLITTYSTSWEFTSKVTISSVTPPSSSTYKNNEVLSFDVNFSDFVNIDPASPPTLTIDIGGQLRTAAYAAGDGTQTLTFNYTVGSVPGSDDIDLDGIELRSPLAGTVTDLWGTAVDPRLTPPSMATVFVLSTTPTIPPTIDSIESGSTSPRITGTAQLSDGDTLSVVVAGISNSYHGSTYTVVPVNNTWTLDMSAVNPDNVSTTGDIPANGTPSDDTITNISTAGLVAGMVVSHPDIPVGTVILTVGATTVTLDASATGGATTGALTFSATPTEAALTNPDNYSVTAIITDAAGNTIDETDVFNTGTTAPTIETLLTSSDVPTIRGSAVLQAGESLSITVNGATYGNVTTSNVTANGDIASGSVEIDNIDTSGLVVGLVVNHSDFPVGTIITAINPTGGSGSNGKITVDQASTVVTPANPTSITFENLWSLDLGTVLPSTGTLGAFVDGVAVDVVATVFGSIGYSITDTTTGELTVDRTLTPVAPGLAILPDAADGATSTEAAAGVVTVSGVLGNTITVTFTGQAGVVEKTVTATGGLAQVVTLTGPELSTLGEGAVQVSAVQTDPAGNVSPSTSATSTPVTGGPQTPATEFDVGIEVGAGLPSTFNAIAEAATNIWSQVIVGDLSDQVHPTTGEVIDELYIEFQAGLLGNSPSDGTNGTLANAGPRNFRGAGDADPFLPYRGEVGIDMADINNPDLLDIVVHEIGHVLGFPGSTPFQNLITPAGFTGSNAVAEFVALGIDPLATAIPLDANESHWAESVLGNEVMSQYAGPQYYLSRVTIGAFEDIGYEVNYAGADTYALFIANAESAFSIDTTVPDDATIALTPGVSDPIGTTTATDSAGFISVEGEAGAEIIVTFTDGSANVVTKTIIGSGAAQQVSLSAADLLLLDDGPVTVEVAQTDAAGNPQTGSPGNQVSITLDTDVPLAPVLALGVGVGDGATAGEATQVGGVVTVNGEASSSIEVTFTGSNGSVIKTIAGTGSAAAVTLNTNDLGNIGGGTVTVSAIQTDAAGNTQTEPASSIIFELTIPIAPTVDALTTNTVPPTITGTTGTSQALNAGEVLTVTINNATYTITANALGDWFLDLSTVAPTSGSLNAFTDGNYPVTATVTDALGHSATDGTTNEITIDTTDPSAPTVDALTTNSGLPTITGTATLAVDEVLTVVISGATYTVTPAGDNTWSVDLSTVGPTSGTLSPSPLTEDTYSVTATVTDLAGNTVNDATTEELVIDTTAPTATPLLALGAGVAGGANLAEATQASGVVTIVSEDDSTIEVSLTGTAGVLTRTLTGSTNPQAIVLTAADVIVLGEGVVTVSATETDAAGNEAAAPVTIQFTVDSIVLAPTLELDASIADGASSAEAQADLLDVTGETDADVEVTFTSAAATITKTLTATGTSADSVVLTAVEISQLGDGRIDVSAIQTDTAGNTSPASTTFFNLDATDPTITDVAVDAGIFRTGQTINFFVTFSENVEVDTTSGTPTLDFVNGSTTLNATFASGSGTNQLRFTYTLDGTEANDTDGIGLSGFTLNAGTIEDIAGNAATLDLPVSIVGQGTTFLMPQPVTASLSIQPNSVDATTGSPTATDPRATPTSYFKINFDQPVPYVPNVIGVGFLDLTDFELTRNGVVIANGTTGAQWPGATELIQSPIDPNDPNGPTEFLISDLASITEETGTYILTFSDIAVAEGPDVNGDTIPDPIQLTWVKTVATPPQLTAFITLDPSTPSPRQTAVDSATITFNQSVVGLDLDDFELVYTDNIGGTPFIYGASHTPWPIETTLSIDGTGAQATLRGLSTIGDAEGSYELRLIHDHSVTGIHGLAYAKLITAVSAEWDVDQIATISSITLPSVPSSGLYKSGEVLEFKVAFNEDVQVNGIPELPLTIGNSNVNATYIKGTGTDTLTFEYTVQEGDLDTDGIGFNGTSLNLPAGSTIQDAAALNASLLFSAPNTPITIAEIRIDAVKPTIVSVSGPPSGRYDDVSNTMLEFRVSFDEEVTLTYSVTPNVVVTIGTETFTADLDTGAHATGSSGTSFTFKIDLIHPLYASAVSVTGVSVDSLNLGAGSTLVDTAGNEADTTLTPASFPGVVVNQAEAKVAVSAKDEGGNIKMLPATLAETDVLIFTADFNGEEVTVTGAPSINMQLGTNIVNAVYSSGSGSDQLEFRYTVQAGDLDLDGIQLPSLAIALNGGTIVDSKSNAASLIFPAPAPPASAFSAVKVDAVDPLAPTVDALITDLEDPTVSAPTITGTVTLGSNETLTVTVDGTTYSSTTGDVTVVGNDWSLDLSAVSSPVTLADKTYEVTATVTDEAGNAASDTTTNELVVDADPDDDVASVTSATPDGSYGIGQVITIDVQMQRAVTVTTTLGSPTLTLNTTPVRNAAFAGAVGNTLSFTYTVQDGDTSTDLDVSALNLNGAVIEDASGNEPSVSSIGTLLSGAHDIVIDTTAPVAPTVTVPQTTNSTAPTIAGTSGTGAALNTGEILSVVVNGATYEVTPDGSGDWSLDLATTSPASGTLGAFVDSTYAVTATVTDEAGNAASDTTTNELVVDTTAPSAPTVDALITDLEDPTVSAPTITGTAVLGEGETLTVTVDGTTYSSITGDVTVVGNDWSLDLSPLLPPPGTLADDTYEVTATVTDAAGNIVNDATTEELVIDTADPEIEFVTTPTADGTYGIGAVINIDIQLSEAVIVNTALGSPTLTLNTTPTRHAEFTGAVGNILSFTYTSQDGDTAANLDVDALNLNGAVIEDAAGNQADDSNLGNTVTLDAAIVINAVIPSATVTVTGLGDNYTYDVDQVIELTADFGTAVDVVGTPTISLLVGDNVVDATYATGSGTSEIKFRYEVQQADLDEDGIEIPTAAIELAANTTITDVELGNDVQLTFTPPDTQNVNVNSLPRVTEIEAAKDGTPITDGSYDTGDVITLTLTTSIPVKVSNPESTKLYLNTDGSNVTDYAIFVGDSSTFTNKLEFQYTVADGDNSEDLDYISTTALEFVQGTITSGAGINLSPNLQVPGTENSLSYGNELIINTRAPQIESFSTINPDGRYSIGQNIVIRATLSEEVAANQTFKLVLDTGVGRTVEMTTDGSIRASGIYTIQPGDSSESLKVLDILPESLTDDAGNSLLTTLPSSITVGNIIVDTTAPTVINFNVTEIDGSAASAYESGIYGVGTALKIEATTDESVRAGSTIEATLNNGDVVRLSAATAGTTLSGIYTVGSDPSSTNPDLSVDSFTPIVMRDVAGNSIDTPTAIPAFPNNIGDVHDLEIDTTPPNVVEFTADDGTYKAGDNIAITATLSEEINGTHDLKVELSSGGFANLAIADGANVAIGNYTVQPGDTASDLTVAKIYAGSIVDFANNQLFTVLPSGTNLGDTADIVLDTTAPTVESLTADLTAINSTQNTTIDITLSENSTDFSIFDLNTTSGRFDPLSFSGSDSNYTVGFIPDAGFEGNAVISVDNGSFNDTVGNAFNSTTPTLTIAVDSKAPTVGISADNTSLLAGDTSTLTLTLSEEAANGTDFGFADLAVSNGTLDINTFTPVTATEYTVVYTPEPDFEGTVTFNVTGSTFSDTFLNPNEASTDFNITVDTKVPTATLTSDLGTVNATQNATINITLNQASLVTKTGDVPAPGGSNDNEITNVDTTDLVVGMTVSGGDVPAAATIASIDSATQLTLSVPVTTGTGTTGESLAFEFKEFEFGDLTVTNGTLDPATFTAINSTEYSVVFIPDAATTGDALISIPADSFKDLSGNNNSVESNLTIAVDTVAPTVVDVTPVLSTLNASQNTVVNINLSEDSADFTVDDLTATNGTFENGSFTGSGSNYSVVFVPDVDIEDNAVVSVANGSLNDLAGNPLNSTAPNATLTLDTKVPTVDITPDDAALSIGENTTLTLTLSDAPGNASDFTFENLSASSGNLSTFTEVSATEYTVVYTPDADFEGNVTVLAAAGQFTDAVLNPNAEGNLTLAVDTKAPVATITSDINPVNGVQNATISITLSEDSSDFDFADLSPTNGVLDPTSFTGSGSDYSVVFIPFSATTDDAVISIAADSFADGSGNNNSVESNLTIVVDTVAPTVLDVTPVLSSLNATQNTSISINLSEDSADFTVDDLTVTNGEFENGSFTGSGSNYSVVFIPDADVEDTAVVSVANGSFTDLAGNPLNSTAPNATLTLDTKAPAAPALTLEAGFPVTDPVGLDEATQDPNGVVSVQGEVGANISVSFTGTGGSVQKLITGDSTTQGVVLNSTEAASLGQGPVSVVATQTDAANNPQTDPASTLSFELDTIAPNAATVAFAAGVTDAVSDAESSAPVTVNGEVDAALTVTFTGDDGSVTQNLTGTGIDQNVNLNAAQLLMIDSDGVGPVEVSVTQSDLAGNNQTASAETLAFALDTVAPSAPGLTLAGSDPLSADEAATPVTISAEANASVTVVFEGVSGNVTQNITGTGSSQDVTLNTAQLATLGDGLVSVSASQVDQAGNPQSGAANTSAFTLDTVAPAAPQLALGNGIVGTVSSDEASRAAGVVTVQGEVASTITVTFLGTSGATVPKSITGDGTAQGVVLTLTDLATLGDGAVSVSATQADEAGNQQTLPATTMSFNLDATAPAAAGLSLNVPTGDLPVGINEVTQPSGIVVVSGELDAEITITFAGQANTIVKPVSGTNTPQPITLTLSEADFLGQGTVTVTVSQTDDAGNLQDAAAASVAFDLDTIAPVTPVVSLESSIIPAVSFDEATQDPAGVVTVVGEAGATVVITLTGSADQIDKTITSTGTDGVVLTNADLIILGEGTVNVSAIQTDPSGNVSPVGTTSFVLDSIAPVAPAIALTSTLDNPVSEAEALSASGVVTVTGEVNAAIAVTFTGQSGTLTRNLTGVGAPQAVILSSGDLTTLGDGSVSVTAVQTDEAGNDSPTGSLPSFVLDTVAPAAPVVALNVSVTDPITASEATQATGIATVTGENGSTITVTLVGSNNLPVVKQIAGNGSTLMPVVLNGSDLIILGEGIVNVTAIQTDEAGNQQTVGGASLSFVLDTVNPEVSHFNATTPSGNYKAGETINLVATLSEVTASGTEFTAVLNTGATVIFTASSTGTVLEGSYTIGGSHNANPLAVTSILPGTVLDEAGNSLATTVPTSNTFNGIAVDTTSPQPAAIVLLSSDPVSGSEATAPGGFATVTAEPGATVVVTINGESGSLPPKSLLGTGSAQPIKLTVSELPTLGDGLVTLTAVQTDAAGNRQILPDQTIDFTLDTVIPATPTMVYGQNVSESDGVTAAEATQAAGVVRVTGEAGASISVTLTGTVGTVTLSPIIANGAVQAARLTSGDLSTLGEGLVIVSAVQTDAAGNTQPIAAELTFQLDTVAPAAPVVNLANGVTNPISLAEATQVAAAGGLLSVRGEAGAELIITFSGALGGVTRTLTATGFNQPIELSPAEVTSLGNGLLDVTARQVDPAGNDSSETPPMNLTLDTVDPTIYSRLLDAPAGLYNAGDQIPVIITLSEPAVPGQQLSVLLNVLDQSDNPVRVLATVGTGANAVKAFGMYTVAPGHNTTDLAIDSVLNDITNNFVTDVAGNKLIDDNAQQSSNISSLASGFSSSSSVSSGIVIDTRAPEIVGISSPSTQTVYNEGDIVTIVVGLSEPVQAGSKIEVKVNSRPDTQPSLVLEALVDGTTMIGHYRVGLAEVANQLSISSTSANILDLAGNQFVHSQSTGLVSSLLSGIEIDGSITVADNGVNWGPQPEEGYQSVTIDLTADVTGVTLDAFTVTHNGRTISLRDASLQQTTSANYVLRLPNRVANLSGGFTITIWSTDIRTLTNSPEDMDSPIVIVIPDPGMNTDLINGRSTGD